MQGRVFLELYPMRLIFTTPVVVSFLSHLSYQRAAAVVAEVTPLLQHPQPHRLLIQAQVEEIHHHLPIVHVTASSVDSLLMVM